MPLLVVFSGCATVQETPRQAYVWEMGRICDGQSAFWKMNRVGADGRYSIRGGENPPGREDYLRCMQAQFAKTPYRKWLSERSSSTPTGNPGPPSGGPPELSFTFDPSLGAFAPTEYKSLARHAYFTATQPLGTVAASNLPAAVRSFKVGQTVIFFLGLDKSGQVLSGKFKWFRPDGKLEVQDDRTLRDGDGSGKWTWYTQVLPGTRVHVPGTWALEAYLNDHLVGRYEFVAVTQ